MFHKERRCVSVFRTRSPRLMPACRDYVPLVNLFGIYFQIRDDYMNLQSTQVRLIVLRFIVHLT